MFSITTAFLTYDATPALAPAPAPPEPQPPASARGLLFLDLVGLAAPLLLLIGSL